MREPQPEVQLLKKGSICLMTKDMVGLFVRQSAGTGGGDGADIQPSPSFTRVAMTAKTALRDIASARNCIAESSRIVDFTDT
ncbi:hypothetical protein [Paracoccus pacificus]|uniref:Uncharacterized protein n=1 Tax=Paracoccus pacificus TaxID=1463598 RepID=A0ABW4R277_9RHOB